jgi:hypothetical protein
MLMIALCTFYACDGGGDGGVPEEFTMRATVRAVREKIEVDVFEAKYASGIYEIIISDVTEIYDKDGRSIDRSYIKEGGELIIIYNGQTMMSLPPQVVARKITVL